MFDDYVDAVDIVDQLGSDDVFRFAFGGDSAVFHDDDDVAVFDGLVDVMQYHDDGDAVLFVQSCGRVPTARIGKRYRDRSSVHPRTDTAFAG